MEQESSRSEESHSSHDDASMVQANDTHDFHFEQERLQSFRGIWPHSAPISAERLAKAGFFYVGVGDKVKCFCCLAEISNWQYGDLAAGKHKQFVPNCDFIQGKNVGNVPLIGKAGTSFDRLHDMGSAEMLYSPPGGVSPRSVASPRSANSPRSTCSSVSPRGMSMEMQNDIDANPGNINNLALQVVPMLSSGSVSDPFRQEVESPECTNLSNDQGYDEVNTQRIPFNPSINPRSTITPASSYDEPSYNQQTVANVNPQSRNCQMWCGLASGCASSPELQQSGACDPPFFRGQMRRTSCGAQIPVSPASSMENILAAKAVANHPPTSDRAFQSSSRDVAGKTSACSETSERALRQAPPILLDRERLKYESERLKSFVKWSVSYMRPEDLAKAGFYYTGSGDRVKCIFCRGMLQGWERNDQPLVEHRKHFSDCRFVRGEVVGNVTTEPVPSELAARDNHSR